MTRETTDLAPDAIRRDIEQTRERMGETIEALGERMNPSRLTQQVKDNVREATIGRMKNMADNARHRMTESGRGIVDTVRENPIPAAMVVGGLAWLLVGSRRDTDQARDDDAALYATADENTAGAPARIAESTRAAKERVSETAHAATQRASEKAHEATQRVSEKAHEATQRVTDGARRMGSSVAAGARDGTRRVSQTYDENPLILGAFAVAAGLAVGLSIPVTKREARVMGAKRDALMDRAKERVQETAERAKHAAERAVPEVTSTIKDVAREEGLAG